VSPLPPRLPEYQLIMDLASIIAVNFELESRILNDKKVSEKPPRTVYRWCVP